MAESGGPRTAAEHEAVPPRTVAVPIVVEPQELSFEDFFRANRAAVIGLAFVFTGSRVAAEDLAQDAFVAAYRRWGRVQAYDDPAAFVRRVVANNAFSFVRRRGREVKALVRFAARPEPVSALDVDDDVFWRQVRELPRRQAQCVALHYFEDRSTGAIAVVLGISETTVRVHLHAGRRRLAELLGARSDEEDDV